MTGDPKSRMLYEITSHYLQSEDFNGIPASDLRKRFGGDPDELLAALAELIVEEKIGVIYADVHLNPHIIRTGFEPKETQISKLGTKAFEESCLYPRPEHLRSVVERSGYQGRPYSLCLALGDPQLSYRAFDLAALEHYRNDPRYVYKNDDISGFISVSDAYYSSNQVPERDKVLVETFGFAYDADLDRAVAVFLRYLADLSPEHQQMWKARELDGDYRLHPDYFRTAILGELGERVPICAAFLKELYTINLMATAMGRPNLFLQDFGEYGEARPDKFTFLVRPTLEEFNAFVLLLDKVLSDNINRGFFRNEVAFEKETRRTDGKIQVQANGTLQILDDWLRKFARPVSWDPWDESIQALRDLRKLRQKPAHVIDENAFDQKYFKSQRELIIKVYNAVRTLRLMLENHPAVQIAGIEIPDWLREAKIWTY
jgi:hypothetical protein